MIASVHIQVELPQLNRIKRYHSIAKAIRTCLHAYGIHSSTIQPEFTDELPMVTNNVSTSDTEDTPLLQESPKNCLFECVGGEQCVDGRCCDTGSVRSSNGRGTSGSRD
jgi:solute carrier family 30 (zinc transporter), member 1